MSDMSSIQRAIKVQEERSIIAMKYRLEFIECLCKNLIEAGMVCEFDDVGFISGTPSESWKKEFAYIWIERLCLQDVENCLHNFPYKCDHCSEFISVTVIRRRSYGCSFTIYVSDFCYYSTLASSDEACLDRLSRSQLKLRKHFMKVIKDTIVQYNGKKNDRKNKRRTKPKTV